MTIQTKVQIEEHKKVTIGKKVINFYYDEIDDYFVIELENLGEFCFRFMADIIRDERRLRNETQMVSNR